VRNRLLLGFVLFAFVATALLVIPLGLTLQAHESADTLTSLEHDTGALVTLLTDAFNYSNPYRAIQLSDSYSRATGRQILVYDGSAILVATSRNQENVSILRTMARAALKKELDGVTVGSSQLSSQYYVAVALNRVAPFGKAKVHPVLIITSPVKVVNASIHSDWTKLMLFGLLMLLLACIFGFVISNSLVRPLRRIGSAVEAIGLGSLDSRAPVKKGPRELRRLAESINSTAVRLITLLEVQQGFVADASHQLRTPLTALQLHLENLQRGDGSSGADDLNAVLAEVGRLNRLVDSLLVLARNESRNLDLITINVHDAILERADVWQPLADELELRLGTTVVANLEGIAVAGVLEQILDNLLSNAFDATPAGGRIAIEAHQVDETIELHVIDDGPGLEPDERVLALQRFWRRRDNNSAGAGLGLAIVDQLVRLSGGSLELREATGGGIDATITLRRA
jgi:signal transduction histidine kinase